MSIAADLAAYLSLWDLTGDLQTYATGIGQMFVEVEGYADDLDGGPLIWTPNGYFPTVVADKPTAYWRLGEAFAGDPAKDQMGGAHTGAYSGTPVMGQASNLGDGNTCVLLNVTSSVVVPNSSALDSTGGFSVEAWIYPTTSGTSYIVDYIDTGPNTGIRVALSSGKIVVSFGVGTGIDIFNTPVNTVPLSAWSHIVVTWSPTAGLLGYLNGVPVSFNGSISSFQANTTATCILGDGLTGNLDEVAIYQYPLTQAQALAHYNARGGSGGIIPSYANSQIGWQPLWDVDIAPHNALPWLAMVMGETLPQGITDAAARSLIRAAPNQDRGTPQAVANAIKQVLTGSQIVGLREGHRSDGTVDNDALAIATYLSQTPDQNAVQAAIRRTLPADIDPYYQCLTGATWATIQGSSTWSAIQAAHGPTWGDIESATVLNGYVIY